MVLQQQKHWGCFHNPSLLLTHSKLRGTASHVHDQTQAAAAYAVGACTLAADKASCSSLEG
jgi:hypothetical protein